MARFAIIVLCILTLLIAAGAVVYNYWTTSFYFEYLSREYNSTSIESSDTSIKDPLLSLDQIHRWIRDLDKAQQMSWLPWSLIFDMQSLKDQQIKRYQQHMRAVLNTLDGSIQDIDNIDPDSRNRALLVLGMIRRINIISTRVDQNHENLEAVAEIPDQYLQAIDSDIAADSAKLFDRLFRYYVRLSPSRVDLLNERNQLRAALETAINASRGNFHWLIQYTESQRFANVKIDDFWPGSRRLIDQPVVSSVYTLSGLNFINIYLDELRLAVPDSPLIAKIITAFMAHYERNYLKAWLAFAEQFDLGKNKLRGREEWLKAVESMSTSKNPYFAVMQKIQREMNPIKAESETAFRQHIDFFARVQQISIEPSNPDNSKSISSTDNSRQNPLHSELSKATNAYLSYRESLKDLSFSIDSGKLSFNEIAHASLNPDNLASGHGAGSKSWGAILDMQRFLGKPDDKTQLFWKLFGGPVRLAYEYMRKDTACYLQDNWEQKVIAELEDETPGNLAAALIGDGGLTWQYMDSFAAPFLLRWPKRGYQSLPEAGINWTPDFINFLNHASRGRSLINEDFDVAINTLPTGVNQTASTYPYQTNLDLNCVNGMQTLSNYNYYTSKNFSWSLSRCSDVILSIQFGQIKLEKHYSGQKGFPKFLADFRDGRRIFTTREFPRQQAQLRNENVRAIDVNYEFRGQETIIEMLNAVPLQPPLQVTECWH